MRPSNLVCADSDRSCDPAKRGWLEGVDSIVLKDCAGKYRKISRAGSEILIVVRLSQKP